MTISRLRKILSSLNIYRGIWYHPGYDMWFEGNMDEELIHAEYEIPPRLTREEYDKLVKKLKEA